MSVRKERSSRHPVSCNQVVSSPLDSMNGFIFSKVTKKKKTRCNILPPMSQWISVCSNRSPYSADSFSNRTLNALGCVALEPILSTILMSEIMTWSKPIKKKKRCLQRAIKPEWRATISHHRHPLLQREYFFFWIKSKILFDILSQVMVHISSLCWGFQRRLRQRFLPYGEITEFPSNEHHQLLLSTHLVTLDTEPLACAQVTVKSFADTLNIHGNRVWAQLEVWEQRLYLWTRCVVLRTSLLLWPSHRNTASCC